MSVFYGSVHIAVDGFLHMCDGVVVCYGVKVIRIVILNAVKDLKTPTSTTTMRIVEICAVRFFFAPLLRMT